MSDLIKQAFLSGLACGMDMDHGASFSEDGEEEWESERLNHLMLTEAPTQADAQFAARVLSRYLENTYGNSDFAASTELDERAQQELVLHLYESERLRDLAKSLLDPEVDDNVDHLDIDSDGLGATMVMIDGTTRRIARKEYDPDNMAWGVE